MTDVATKVIEIIAEQASLDVSTVHLDSKLDSLGISSLGLVEMIFALEDSFDISVPFNANGPDKSDFDGSSVGSIIALVNGLLAQKAKCTA